MRALLPLLLSLSLFAQTRPPSTSATIEVRLLEVDAVVTDKAGNPVSGLGPDDFELFENGRRQVITNFAEYRETEGTIAQPVPVPSGGSAAAPPEKPAPRTIVILIDTPPYRGAYRKAVYGRLRRLVDRVVRDGDRAQLLSWSNEGGVSSLTPLTANKAELEKALVEAGEQDKAPEGRGLTVQEQARWLYGTGNKDAKNEVRAQIHKMAEEELTHMSRKTAAMQRLIGSLTMPNDKPVFLYVSDHFPLYAGRMHLPAGNVQFGTHRLLDAITRTANASGVSFYAIRPDMVSIAGDQRTPLELSPGAEASLQQALLQNQLDALTIVAEKTGGAVTFGPEAIEQAAERIIRDLGSYYTLAYKAGSDGSDRERRIAVRAKNRDYVVRARRTLVERSDKTRAKDLVVARLFERGPAGDIDFEINVLPAQPGRKGRLLIPIELKIPVDQLRFADEGSERAAKFTLLAVAGQDIGLTTDVTEKSHRVTAPLGVQPEGHLTYTFELLTDGKPTLAAISLFDEKSGLAGSQTVRLEGGHGEVLEAAADPAAEAEWKALLARAESEQTPIVVYFRPTRCNPCARFEKETIQHPTIQRRLGSLTFTSRQAKEPGIALFDRTGIQRARWNGIPDTTRFGEILDAVIANVPFFESGSDVDAAIGLARLGQTDDARKLLDQVIAGDSAEARQQAAIARAMLDRNVKALEDVIATAVNPEIAGDAWFSIGALHVQWGATDSAIHAFATAAEVVAPNSPVREAAQSALAQLRPAGSGVIRIVPLGVSIVSGRRTVKTSVTSAAVASVSFWVDGKVVKRIDKPPFSTPIDFGSVPERHLIRAIAYDAKGAELGSDEMTVNNAGEMFGIRLVEPREGAVSGPVRVAASLRVPPMHRVQGLVMKWNNRERALLTAPPWEAVIDVPHGEMGVLQVTAELDDGRQAEDAVLLNARGATERADVQLVELPITIAGGGFVSRENIIVREGGKQRTVDSITPAAEAPLTVGLLIDSSASMHQALPNVQEAALRFLDTVLTERDRAFLIVFDSNARIIQLPTADKAVLRERILAIRAEGLTALHDAIALGLLQFEGVKGRRALIVFSDGVDRTSRYDSGDVAELARRSNVPLHIIAAQPDIRAAQNRLSQMNEATMNRDPDWRLKNSLWYRSFQILQKVAESTGGTSHMLGKLADLSKVYAEIEAALRSQMLAFVRVDPATRDNEWRSIKVEIAGKNVLAPSGYYAW